MTIRSVLLGLLGAALVCGLTFFNDRILRQSFLVGSNLPVSVYGTLLLFVILVNPLLRRLALTGRELAVILTLTLVACAIPGSGLLRTFTSALVLPHHYAKTEPGWEDAAGHSVVQMAPKHMLVDVNSENYDHVVGHFVRGLGTPGSHAALSAIPWSAWTGTLVFWLPIILVLWVALIGLSVAVHPQWSRNEHLPYPIATFANSLLPQNGSPHMGLVRSRLFWLGTLFVLGIHLNNYACAWFPNYLIPIPLQFSLGPLVRLFPFLVKTGSWWAEAPRIYFVVIGIAFLIPSDAALAFGLGPYFWALVVGTLAAYGIQIDSPIESTNWYTGLKVKPFIFFGANLGVFLTVMYTGRHHYWNVFRQSVMIRSGREADRTAVWGLRVFLVLMGVFVLLICSRTGLDPTLGILYAAVLVILYVVMARVIAETGLFCIQPYFFPSVILWGLYGAKALGPTTLLIMQLISLVLIIDPRESLIPFVVNSLKLLESRNVKLGRAAAWSVVSLLLGLAIALPVTLYIQYDQGSSIWEGWAEQGVPKMQFQNALAVKQGLAGQGVLEFSEKVSGWDRLRNMRPNMACVWGLVAGLGLVLVFAAARLRFSWWPLHPLMFVVWGAWAMQILCASFLLGWFAKQAAVRLGGNRLCNRLKPLMIGLIAGEVLGAVFPSIVGAAYYFITGDLPRDFRITPE